MESNEHKVLIIEIKLTANRDDYKLGYFVYYRKGDPG